MIHAKLRLTGRQHAALAKHLFPGDGLEAAALLLCGRRQGTGCHVLTVCHVELIPQAICDRDPDRVTWPTHALLPLLAKAAVENLAIVKVHSHPGGDPYFSLWDDVLDRQFFGSMRGWTDVKTPHASVVILPDRSLFGRSISARLEYLPLSLITVVGDDLHVFPKEAEVTSSTDVPAFAQSHWQALGSGTTNLLRRLSVAVVGCSGTGSLVVEQLTRLGVRKLVLIDPDHVEERNLNRIMHASRTDVGRAKVDVLAEAVSRIDLGTFVEPIKANLFDGNAVTAVAGCDVVFGCVDGAEGRHLLNRLCVFYCLPYIDVGVRLEADGAGGISQICGGVNYLQPDGSSLLSRGLISFETIESEGLKRTNPKVYARHRREKYIAGVDVDRPAVISVNMHYASLAVLELLARLHRYRDDGNAAFAWHGSTLTGGSQFNHLDGAACATLARHVGRGDVQPLLDMPALSEVTGGEDAVNAP